ncbi:MAG: [Fe-Fe] hydrogenase large subunit C-terminal domain-containing protein [Candidatus Riflebacteria bacterium]|nr:[Fe-Fe] hydrogenase large subunit C-terminal domain-containing protein [Candidatus Riflebacteria bacterium]
MDKPDNAKSPVVFTNKAQCRDCYRCLRQCPVKAIRMIDGQASVDPDRCIACGTCIKECPQGAKQYRNDLEQVIRLLKEPFPVAVSLAPSFVAFFSEWERRRLSSALRKLGFSYVVETAVGAYPVALESLRNQKKNGGSICTACPAVVSFVEKYMPELAENLLPVVSPMLAHAAIIRKKLGNATRIVFIGPCIAKKIEADKSDGLYKIDCALTFKELEEWFERENIKLDCLEDSLFDDQPAGEARLFPLSGGLTRTADMGSDSLISDIIAVSGHAELKKILETLLNSRKQLFIEPLFCSQGCVNGPGAPKGYNLFENRREVIDYALTNPGKHPEDQENNAVVDTAYNPEALPESDVAITEEAIQKVLAATGKTSPADELNCGACGYDSCRDKAIAVIRGFAETDMCIPYMRRLAEQRTDRIIETSPNGIVMLDDKLTIISMNPAFRKMFLCSEAVLGKHISYLVDPEPFEKVITGSENIIEQTVKHARYNLIAHQIIYQLEIERQLVGIFVNITGSRKSIEELAKLRSSTIQQAREMLEHQVKMAQEMAKYLGESTAQGESIIENLLKLTESEDEGETRRKGREWDIFTSK